MKKFISQQITNYLITLNWNSFFFVYLNKLISSCKVDRLAEVFYETLRKLKRKRNSDAGQLSNNNTVSLQRNLKVVEF